MWGWCEEGGVWCVVWCGECKKWWFVWVEGVWGVLCCGDYVWELWVRVDYVVRVFGGRERRGSDVFIDVVFDDEIFWGWKNNGICVVWLMS